MALRTGQLTRTPAPAAAISLGLGAMMLAFGLLKLIEPFRGWYAAQVSTSGLPAPSYPLGIASEVLAGLLLVGGWILRRRLGARLAAVWTAASFLVAALMVTATYVHMRPDVPGSVLPLQIKAPIIPLAVLAIAIVNLYIMRRFAKGPAMGVTKLDRERFGPWAVVTGASSGIGREFARQLASAGLDLVLVARRGRLLEEVSQNLSREFGIECKVVVLDATKERFISELDAAIGGLDVGLLVSMHGAGTAGSFLKTSREELDEILASNLTSHLDLVHHFAPKLVARGRGGVVLVGAMGASLGVPYIANIAASKAYIESFGEALHIELKEHNVRVFTLLPGPTNTDLIVKEFGMEVDKMPMKPMSVEQCVAEGLEALQADRSSHIPGRLNRVMRRFMHTGPARQFMTKMQRESAARLNRL